MTDLQIIELYWQRNEDAIRESDDKYGRYCFTVANMENFRFFKADQTTNLPGYGYIGSCNIGE